VDLPGVMDVFKATNISDVILWLDRPDVVAKYMYLHEIGILGDEEMDAMKERAMKERAMDILDTELVDRLYPGDGTIYEKFHYLYVVEEMKSVFRGTTQSLDWMMRRLMAGELADALIGYENMRGKIRCRISVFEKLLTSFSAKNICRGIARMQLVSKKMAKRLVELDIYTAKGMRSAYDEARCIRRQFETTKCDTCKNVPNGVKGCGKHITNIADTVSNGSLSAGIKDHKFPFANAGKGISAILNPDASIYQMGEFSGKLAYGTSIEKDTTITAGSYNDGMLARGAVVIKHGAIIAGDFNRKLIRGVYLSATGDAVITNGTSLMKVRLEEDGGITHVYTSQESKRRRLSDEEWVKLHEDDG
jgi:hypothetical protein